MLETWRQSQNVNKVKEKKTWADLCLVKSITKCIFCSKKNKKFEDLIF